MKWMKEIGLLFFTIALSLCAYSTNQFPELLIRNGDTIYIEEYPLNLRFEEDTAIASILTDIFNDFCISSACWRGYKGIWKLENDSLFLFQINPCCKLDSNDSNPFNLESIFSEEIRGEKVFAGWVNDTLNSKCTSLPCDKYDFHYVIVKGELINEFETLNSDWKERNPDYIDIEKIDPSDIVNNVEVKEEKNSNWYIASLFFFGFIVIYKVIKRIKKNVG